MWIGSGWIGRRGCCGGWGEVPVLADYDPARDPEEPWEGEVRVAIEMLKAEKMKTVGG
jgi:hypothetical protein